MAQTIAMTDFLAGDRRLGGPRLLHLVAYAILIVGGIGGFLLIRSAGLDLTAPPPPGDAVPFGAGGAASHAHALPHLLLALAAVIALARILGYVCRRIGQPSVIGEIVAGIALGPSLLGRIAPDVAAFVLPASVAPFLQIVAQIGVIVFMFLVGVGLDVGLLRRRGHAVAAVSHASIVVPFLLGSLLALAIYPVVSTGDVPFTAFALFLGISMSVTAFPVLARILIDRGMERSRLGTIALSCAAVDDVSAWSLLAVVVGIVKARASDGLTTAALAVGYVAVAWFVVRPLLHRLARHTEARGELSPTAMAAVLVAVLLSAWATDAIGIHALFGAFLVGAAIPHDSLLARELGRRLHDLVVVLLLPAFFAFTGMRTQIGLLDAPWQWLLCAAIVLIACAGKLGGSAVAARLSGLDWRSSLALGVLMNTRGLMELIVLNIGLELKVISPALFAMLVLMALVTTFATTPLLHWLTRGRADA